MNPLANKMRNIAQSLQHRWRSHAAMRARTRALAQPSKPVAPPLLDLALVIPVWNDQAGLDRLLQQAATLRCFQQIIVVDDGSQAPVTVPDDITLIRHDTPKGAGGARNAGLPLVVSDYVLFFDADDLFTEQLPELCTALHNHQDQFDFCLFKHADSRLADRGRWGQPAADETFWQTTGLSIGSLQSAPAHTWPQLAQTANYPWNKIYRTAFLRAHNIRCGDTPVHEDIPLHWFSFLHATEVLTSDRICAWHHVDTQGGRQTNRNDAVRLSVFDALAPVAAQISAQQDPAWQASFARFGLALTAWISHQIAPEHLPALKAAEAQYLTKVIHPWTSDIAKLDPHLAQRLQR